MSGFSSELWSSVLEAYASAALAISVTSWSSEPVSEPISRSALA
jgi:hypothetical protein